MKRSSVVRLGLLGSIAFAVLTLPACDDPPVRRCVDPDQKVVEDNWCGGVDNNGNPLSDATPTPTPTVDQNGVAHPFFYPYRWYYGGPRGFVPIGTRVQGGGFAPPAGAGSFAHPTSRGVIGHYGGGGE